jgi:hypothetical protein
MVRFAVNTADPAEAEICAVDELLALLTWAENCVLVCPAGTATLDGTESTAPVVVAPTETGNPPEGAAPDKLTVHWLVPGATIKEGAQESPVSVTAAPVIVTVAPVPEAAMGAPDGDAATIPVICIELDVELGEPEMPNVAVAITPSARAVVLSPVRAHE